MDGDSLASCQGERGWIARVKCHRRRRSRTSPRPRATYLFPEAARSWPPPATAYGGPWKPLEHARYGTTRRVAWIQAVHFLTAMDMNTALDRQMKVGNRAKCGEGQARENSLQIHSWLLFCEYLVKSGARLAAKLSEHWCRRKQLSRLGARSWMCGSHSRIVGGRGTGRGS